VNRLIRALGAAALLTIVAACSSPPPAPTPTAARSLLYVWAGDVDESDPDFLAVIDADAGSPGYGRLIATVPVDGRGNVPHHTEYELTDPRSLFANGWGTGRTFIFDLADATVPRVAAVVAARGDYSYPHSYARLANGHVLATFQTTGARYSPPGGLVELDAAGAVVRAVSAAAPGVAAAETWAYSLLVLEDLDRVVSTNTRMGLPDEWKSAARAAADPSHTHVSQDVKSTHIQIWRRSDLTLLHTLHLPPQAGGHHEWTAEPRRLANGDVYVNTFSCGLYRITGIGSDAPSIAPAGFSPFKEPGYCAVPVVVGNFWIQPSATERAIIAYDLSDAASPREVSRLVLDPAYSNPHWLSLDQSASRFVVTADDAPWILIVNVDGATGALAIDEGFRDAGVARAGVTFDRAEWPHGRGGRAQPHGAVFGRAQPVPR
jgi:hypothetical protein